MLPSAGRLKSFDKFQSCSQPTQQKAMLSRSGANDIEAVAGSAVEGPEDIPNLTWMRCDAWSAKPSQALQIVASEMHEFKQASTIFRNFFRAAPAANCQTSGRSGSDRKPLSCCESALLPRVDDSLAAGAAAWS